MAFMVKYTCLFELSMDYAIFKYLFLCLIIIRMDVKYAFGMTYSEWLI